MDIRYFRKDDAEAVSELITHTLRTTNAADYSAEYIEKLCACMQADHITERAENSHFYVIEADSRIVACGAIAIHYDDSSDSILLNIFVHPQYQGKGVGRKLMHALETDEYYQITKRTVLHASFTAVQFYHKLGYVHQKDTALTDRSDVVMMEKIH